MEDTVAFAPFARRDSLLEDEIEVGTVMASRRRWPVAASICFISLLPPAVAPGAPLQKPKYSLDIKHSKNYEVIRLVKRSTGRAVWTQQAYQHGAIAWSHDRRAVAIDIHGGPLLVWREGHRRYPGRTGSRDYTMGMDWSSDDRRVLVRVGISGDIDFDCGDLYCLNAENGKSYTVARGVRSVKWRGCRKVVYRTVTFTKSGDAESRSWRTWTCP